MEKRFPGRCNRCGKLGYASNGMQGPDRGFSGFSGITMIHQGSCPCGGDMVTLEGDYRVSAHQAQLISGPPSSWQALKELTQVLKDSVAAGEAPEKTIERIGAIDNRLLRFRKYALPAVVAIAKFLDWASHANTAYDLYDTLSGNKAQQEYSQQVEASKEGTRQALEEFYATKEYQDFKKRLDEEPSPPPPTESNSGGPGLKSHPMLIEFPQTARKLADYEKSRRKHQ